MSNVFSDSARTLKEHAERHSACLVAFSGGKDSLAVMDLCVRAFRQVVGFYMYIVPGLRHIEEELEAARARWGIEIVYYPHWVMFKALRAGVFVPNSSAYDDLPEVKLADIYAMVRQDLGIELIAHGGKDADGLWRRRMFSNTKDSKKYQDVFYPIKGWSKWDVLAYLNSQKIPIPEVSKKEVKSGMDLSTKTLLWLHDTHPDDFDRVEKVFRYVRAVVKRREWYGVK